MLNKLDKLDEWNKNKDYIEGNNYFYGIELPLNYTKAWESFENAADNNHPIAYYMLGVLCELGFVIEKKRFGLRETNKPYHIYELKEPGELTEEKLIKVWAKYYFHKSAYLGYAPAQYKIAECYEDNDLRKYAWYLLSLINGHDSSSREKLIELEKQNNDLSKYNILKVQNSVLVDEATGFYISSML